MNTTRILTTTIALLLTARAFAITDTWDGGGADNFVGTNANWADNTAPVSDLVNTDLIFGGTTRLTPNFSDGFSMDSITFNNTAGAFNLTGLPLQLGTTGIIDNDADTQTISALVTVNTPTTTINAASGGLHFAGGLLPNGKALTFTGAGSMSMANLNGPGTVTKSGAGTVSIFSSASAISANLNVNAGALQVSVNPAFMTQNFSGIVNLGAASLAFNQSATFSGTAQLNRATTVLTSNVSVATDKTLRFENGSDFNIAGNLTLTGGGTVEISGAGSKIEATGGGSIEIADSELRVLAGAAAFFTGASVFNVGNLNNGGQLEVFGAGSSLVCGNTVWHFAYVIFNAGAVANLQAVTMSGTSDAFVSNGIVQQTLGSLVIGGSPGDGRLRVLGNNAAWTQTGNIGVTLGGGGQAELLVTGGGVFTTGMAGATVTGSTIQTCGRLQIEFGGRFSTPVNLRVTGAMAELIRDSTGILDLPAGQTLQLEAGALASFTGDFAMNGIHLNATGTNSRLLATGSVIVANGSNATIEAGSRLDATVNVTAGTGATTSTVTVNGTGAQLLSGSTTWGSGGTGHLTLSNSAAGTLGTTLIGSTTVAGSTGVVQVLAGATATSTNLSIGTTTFVGNSGTLTLDGPGSAWTQNAAGTLTIGAAVTSTGALNVRNGGVFNAGTGPANLRKTGTISIQGGTFNANSDLFIDGGLLTRDSTGTLTFEPGKNVTVQNGGDITITGAFTNAAAGGAATITLTGAGTTFTTTGPLDLRDNGDVLVDGGATLATGAAALTVSSGTDLIVDGPGASLSAGLSTIGSVSGIASLTLRNGGTGALGGLQLAPSGAAGTAGNLSVESGGSLTATSLSVGSSGLANTAAIAVTGAGSKLTITGSGTTTIGAASTSLGTLTVENGGTFTTGTGLTEVRATGAVNINAGGTLSGAADFSGTGTVNIAGAFLPGTMSGVNQTTSVSFTQNMTFQPTTHITMELGGPAPGTQHDQLVFSGPGATHVTWGGTLTLLLINGFAPQAGQSFNLLDYDAARDAGSFSSITLPTLPGGLDWDISELYTTGEVSITTTLAPIQQWRQLHFGIVADSGDAADLNDFDFDGFANLIEYALAMDPRTPNVAGAPVRGVVNVAGVDYLSLTITRPLSAPDISYRFQVGGALPVTNDGSFYSAGGDATTNAFTTQVSRTDDGTFETIVVRDNTPMSAATSRFMALKVSNP